MRIAEYGEAGKPLLLLIHGFQSPVQVWDEYTAHYSRHFHVLVPVLPGHDPETKQDFVSLEQTVREIEEYILPRYGKDVCAVYGMSMGGVVAAMLGKRGRLHFEKMIFDGSPLGPMNGMMKMMKGFYISVTRKTKARDEKTVAQAMRSIIPEKKLPYFLAVMDQMTDETIHRCIASIAAFRLSRNLQEWNTKFHYFHGTAAGETMARLSARFIRKHVPGASIHCFRGMGHCEKALFHPEEMSRELDDILL